MAKKVNSKDYKSAVENLELARKLIRRMNRWITGDFATTKEGESCNSKAKEAHAFCALGAVRHANGPGERQATAFLRQAARYIREEERGYPLDGKPTNGDVISVNDSGRTEKTHRRVLSMFARAIKMAKAATN